MRFSLDSPEPKPQHSPTSVEDPKWVPLQNHPVFTPTTGDDETSSTSPKSLLAWDGSSRLFFWDNTKKLMNRISVRLGEPEPTSVIAASSSRVLQTDVPIDSVIEKISINRDGSAMLLAGLDGLYIMYLYGCSSTKDGTIMCRTVSIGSPIYSNEGSKIRVLQVSWHPCSDTHVGVLSSDSVFRLFDLSTDLMQPEQEFYLQPVEPGRCKKAASLCPVDFYFGADHLWDRFSVFVLFSDGTIYVLCPVVPFRSIHKWEFVLEIHGDAQTFGLKSANSAAVRNCNLAISWLEGTFPELSQQAAGEANLSTVKAHPYAVFDASLCLQGPMCRVGHGKEDQADWTTDNKGRAVSLLYNLISKDSVLVTAWSGGHVQIDALADEIQPMWNVASAPRVRVDSFDRIIGLAMICESVSEQYSPLQLNEPPDSTTWLGHPPPLLRLATVDLALPQKTISDACIAMFADPLMPERMYCLHAGGIDSIVVHFLPFSSQNNGKDESTRTPSVHPVLSTCPGETSSPSPLCGCVSLSDSFGYTWIVAVTSSHECLVLEMRTWDLLPPVHVDTGKEDDSLERLKESDTPGIISKELLGGPKVVLAPQTPPNLRSIAADSIEGRSIQHQYFKLFHENYVEYAHKVYFELKHHAPQLKRIIDDQHARMVNAQQRLAKVEVKQAGLDKRLHHVKERHNILEQRLQHLRNLPGVHKKPLSRAEREFKSELDQFTAVELDALRSSIEALNARLRRYTQSLKKPAPSLVNKNQNLVQDGQILQLKAAVEKLSLVNNENLKKVKLVESAIKNMESQKY